MRKQKKLEHEIIVLFHMHADTQNVYLISGKMIGVSTFCSLFFVMIKTIWMVQYFLKGKANQFYTILEFRLTESKTTFLKYFD